MSRCLAVIALLALALSDAPAASRKASGITPAQCAQIREAVAKYGGTFVLLAARLRGYTADEVAYARRACRI